MSFRFETDKMDGAIFIHCFKVRFQISKEETKWKGRKANHWHIAIPFIRLCANIYTYLEA